jgi:hypothetical protein
LDIARRQQRISRKHGLHAVLSAEVSYVTRLQLSVPGLSSYFSNLARGTRSFNTPFSLETKLFIDAEVIVFTLAIFLLSMLPVLEKGKLPCVNQGIEDRVCKCPSPWH